MLLDSNREGIEQNEWLSAGYIPGYINTSDGLAEIPDIANLRNLISANLFRIVTGGGKEIRRKYQRRNDVFFYPGAIQEERIRTQTCDARLARAGVWKWR